MLKRQRTAAVQDAARGLVAGHAVDMARLLTVAAAIATVEPDQVTAGDTVKWTKALADYPSSAGWVLSYNFILDGGAGAIDFNATGTPDNGFSVAVSANDTGAWLAGKYTGQAKVTLAAETYTVWQGRLEVLPNMATAQGQDNRPWFKIALCNVELVIKGTASKEIQEMEIEGQRLMKRTPAELWALHDRLKVMCITYDQKFAAANGKGNPRVKLSRFVRPR